MNEILGIVILVLLLAGFSILTGGGRSASDLRMRRRWESSFESEIRRARPTDATGVLMCRRCGACGSERAGRCPLVRWGHTSARGLPTWTPSRLVEELVLAS